jgi:hypothetical protein
LCGEYRIIVRRLLYRTIQIIELFRNKINSSLELEAASLECTLFHGGNMILFLKCLHIFL